MKPLLLRQTLASLFCSACAALAMAADKIPLDENLVALFADPHVSADPQLPHQRAGLTQSIQDILACNPRPANVLIYGDLSFHHGEPADYVMLKQLLKPLEDAGIRWNACLGNHDRREPFLETFPDRRSATPPVPGRLVTVVTTPHADFILLDSCLEGPTNGGLDEPQLAWLQQTLARATQPVFVGAHHPLKETGVAALLRSTAWTRGYIYGHAHAWMQQAQEDVATLCLPSTGQWGDIGYVLVQLSADEAVFTLHQRDYYTPRPAATPADLKPEWKLRTDKNNGSQWHVLLRAKP